MIESQFFLQNAHFALNLFAALIFFATAWLYFDAWGGRKNLQDGLKILGFFLISISFVLHATLVEQTILAAPIFGAGFIHDATIAVRLAGYIFLIFGIAHDSLLKRPSSPATTLTAAAFAPSILFPTSIFGVFLPILAATVGFLYLRKSTYGLEHHLKPVSLSFFVLSVSELFALSSLFRGTNNISLYKIVAPFGPLWIFEHAFLLIAIFTLGKWVFSYLLKRIQTQLFMILTSIVLLVFLLTTVTFTGLLISNLKNDAISHLKTDVNVLQYSIESKKAEILSTAEALARNPGLSKAILLGDKQVLHGIATDALLSKKESTLVITATNGAVLVRGEDPGRAGDSLSSDPVFSKLLSSKSVSSVVRRDGVLAPVVSVRAGARVEDDSGAFMGAVIIGSDIDNVFVDGVKKATGLDASIYGGNIRAATTFLSQDGRSRWTGIREETPIIKKAVLSDAKPYTGSVDILNTSYLAAFLPLKNADNNPVGMLFVGQEETSVLQTAGRAIEFTFLTAVILLLFSVAASYFVARYITSQLK